MFLTSFKHVFIVFVLAVTLAGCKSAEEQVKEHYENGLALIEAGDYDRAMIEFRNVFQIDGSHRDARFRLAEILLNEKADPQRAYRQYLRLAEQYPDDLEVRVRLSEIAFGANNWEELDRHGTRAAELAPDDPRVETITIARAYRDAAVDEDQPARRAQAQAARALLDTQSESVMLRSILVDDDLRAGDLTAGLAGLDWMLERDPGRQQLWRQRLNILAQLDDMPAVEAQLIEMVQNFPDDISNKQALLRFYMSRNQPDEAEAFLRAQVEAAAEDDPGPMVDLLRFLEQVRGIDATRVELERAIVEQADPVPFRGMRASIDFDAGERAKAVADLESLLEETEDSTESLRLVRVTLAQMLLVMGNEVGARAQVEEVLAQDPGQAQALKMQATWQIEADAPDAAVASLRSALDSEPEDAVAMTLMAQAYMRMGRQELAREFLALAVEASNNAPEETIRYARLLMEEERYRSAEDILLPALRLSPQNTDLLGVLGGLYLAMEDMGRTDQVIETLRRQNTPVSTQAANNLETARINRFNGRDEAIGHLENLAGQADATMSTKLTLVQAQLQTGNAGVALELARDLLAEDPQNVTLQAMVATVETANGNFDTAETMYRNILETDQKRPAIWMDLVRLRTRQNDPDGSNAVLEEALTVMPENPSLLWAKASNLEQNGNVDGAIEIYEDLYGRDSSSVIIANNLASLLSTYRADDDSLERAWTIARRFKDTELSAMQDTYGWIAHRRGDSAEALPYLESAAQGLPRDPLVQYHLGQVYLALARQDEAAEQFRRAIALASPADQRPQIVEARAFVDAYEAAPETGADN